MNHKAAQYRTFFSSQRTAAVGVILIQCAVLFIMMEAATFSVCAAVLACCGLFAHKKGWLISLPGDFWVFLLGAVFVVKYSFAPKEFDLDDRFLFTDFTYEVAMFCVVVELCHLYRKQNREKLPTSFLVFAVIGLVCTCNVRLNGFRRLAMLLMTQCFLFMSMLFSMKSRRFSQVRQPRGSLWRNSIMWGVLIGSAALGTSLSLLLHRYEHAFERVVNGYLAIGDRGPARNGFSNRGGLSDISSWQSYGGEKVALRVESDAMPGYLRGKVFNEFQMNRWVTTERSRTLAPSPRESVSGELSAEFPDDEHLYLVSETIPKKNRIINVWPVERKTAGHCFAPLEAVAFTCRSKPVSVDRNRIVARQNEPNVVSYSVIVDSKPSRDGEVVSSDFLQLPGHLDERVVQVAQELFAGAESPQAKIQLVQQYFQRNFQYRLGVDLPRGEDPLGYFLEHRPPAHCEFFATASAILLRLGGVPSRYVTGYLAQEQSEVDMMWVARRKDAHAWVEAYDSEEQRWVLVESTPETGVPSPSQTDVWQNRREAVAHYCRSLQDKFVRGNYLQALWFLLQPLMWGIVAIGVGIGLQLLLKRRVRRDPTLEFDESEEWPDLVIERQKMDKMMSRIGFQREPGETSTRFAERIALDLEGAHAARLADWYRQYTVCRYRPGTRRENVEALRAERETLNQKRFTRINRARTGDMANA
ncbi:transglutaminase family protein [Thalassoglobus polymorphus]|uniref:Protein-glutamine gamma-glutamyltransferase n=1 Tax=Thalassoglobus polymorphus TaxID=2527994 RepID=A0A517QH93_9PLAN|nr:transglutaminase domain-containing protein [Thalassoglobus polymorphus]QDT31006.1 Protein-glutamine gamma-glutamyltransferase [Thalassoglobus polymorphus]